MVACISHCVINVLLETSESRYHGVPRWWPVSLTVLSMFYLRPVRVVTMESPDGGLYLSLCYQCFT